MGAVFSGAESAEPVRHSAVAPCSKTVSGLRCEGSAGD